MKHRILAAAVTVALAPLAFGACTQKERKVLTIKGSDTMVNLGGAWAEAFAKKQPDVSVAITGGGSGTGIAALINGTCDAAQCSRAMKEKERKEAEGKGNPVKEFHVGIDAIVVAVHPDNPVGELSVDQLSDIYSGKIANWKDVGGPDAPIHRISRERNSGTHVYFLEEIVRKGDAKAAIEFAADTVMAPSSQTIYDEVAQNKHAIGYYGLGYFAAKNKAVRVSHKGKPAVAPSLATALDGTYPIARPLFIYTRGEPQGALKEFMDFVVSDEGQTVVEQVGFVPLKKAKS